MVIKSILGIVVVCILSASMVGAQPAPTMEEQVAELVNAERWNNGQLAPLKHNSYLDQSSETHSINMGDRNFFAHCDLDESTLPWDRMIAAGYSYNWAGENIAAGYPSAQAVMTGWMNSSGHRANILNTNFREVGVGYYYESGDASTVRRDSNGDCTEDGTPGGPYYRYWTQNFGSISSVYPVVINREAHSTSTHTVDLYVYGSGWATEMRFSNDGALWSAWEPFSANKTWGLSGLNELKTVYAEIRSGGGSVKSAQDQIHLASSVVAVGDEVPGTFAVSHAAPNPFSGSTRLQVSLAEPQPVTVRVFDVAGRLVQTVMRKSLDQGSHQVIWDGLDTQGVRVPEGVYFLRVQAGPETRVVKVVHRR